MTNYQYIVAYDPLPDLSYLDQPEFADIDPNDVITYIVTQERQCKQCKQWEPVDTIGGFDDLVNSSEDILTGTYQLDDLPDFMAEHFDAEDESH